MSSYIINALDKKQEAGSQKIAEKKKPCRKKKETKIEPTDPDIHKEEETKTESSEENGDEFKDFEYRPLSSLIQKIFTNLLLDERNPKKRKMDK